MLGQLRLADSFDLRAKRGVLEDIRDKNSNLFPSSSLTLGFLGTNLTQDQDELLEPLIILPEKELGVPEHGISQVFVLFLCFLHIMSKWH